MVDGKLIEKPVLRQMQRTVDISKKLKSPNGMNSFEKEINKSFLKFLIPFVDYGITSSNEISLEGIFRHPEFPILPQDENSLFRMASMTKPITAYLTLAVLNDNKIDLREDVGTYLPEINNLKIAYKEADTIQYKKNNVAISFHHLLNCTSGHAYEQHDPYHFGVGIKRSRPDEKR